MRLFVCPACKLPVFFGNVKCERCSVALGYDPVANVMVALTEGGASRYCANRAHDVCDWVLPAGSTDELCRACRHNEIIPDLSRPESVLLWRNMEEAKHRLLYTILRLRLPLFDRRERSDGLGFQFLAAEDPATHVKTGHAGGLITIALVEADDAEREQRRARLHEPYRTLLGHFRHEVGHWYWDLLVRDNGPVRAAFTALFGDADQDYGTALARYYANGPRPDWQNDMISAYACAHPWEDFAETWAHYFHIVDTIETGGSYSISLRPRIDGASILTASLDFDVYDPALDMPKLTSTWIALASALNSFNRSMGLPDPYPFIVPPKAHAKLGFIHALVHGAPRKR